MKMFRLHGVLSPLAVALVFAVTMLGAARAEVRLPAMFSDHMVLQASSGAPVWGWADPGETVTVSLGSQSQTATAGSDGKWTVKLAADHEPCGR